MNNNNYIKESEKVQNKEKKYWSYIYEIKHLPTGKLYVGSRSNKKYLKKFEDCYTDKYMGSSSRKDGPFSEIDKELNPQDYQKTVLKVFYSEDSKLAYKYEHGEDGLISTYWKIYDKDICLNQHYIKLNGDKVFSFSGNKHLEKTKKQISNSLKGEKNSFYGHKHSIEFIQKMKDINKGKILSIEHKNNMSYSAKTKYECPYNENIIRTSSHMSNYIRKNYPNEKQWMEYNKNEREQFKI